MRQEEHPLLPQDADACRPLRTVEDLQIFLHAKGMFHMDLRLNRMEKALEALGISHLPCPLVHVVGTNGKGSTSAFLHALARSHGKTSALFTSPHFVDVTERLRIEKPDGTSLLTPEEWPALAERALTAEPDLTYFELVTVMAALAVAEKKPDIAIFEAGLGAWHDATTALASPFGIFVCFTPIAMDHAQVLGPHLENIAEDKAHAMRPGVLLAVSAKQEKTVGEKLEAQAQAAHVPLFFPNHGPSVSNQKNWRLKGIFQKENAANALHLWQCLCHTLKWQTNEQLEQNALVSAFIPGRCQFAGPYILDGGHNPHGVSALVNTLQAEGIQPKAIVFACMADKDVEGILQNLGQLAPLPVFLPALRENSRAAKPADLAPMLAAFGFTCHTMPTVESALTQAKNFPSPHRTDHAPVLVCGSLYLLAEFYTLFPLFLKK